MTGNDVDTIQGIEIFEKLKNSNKGCKNDYWNR